MLPEGLWWNCHSIFKNLLTHGSLVPKVEEPSLNLDLPIKLIHCKNRFYFCFSIYATCQASPSSVLGPLLSPSVASAFCSSLHHSFCLCSFQLFRNQSPHYLKSKFWDLKTRERGGFSLGNGKWVFMEGWGPHRAPRACGSRCPHAPASRLPVLPQLSAHTVPLLWGLLWLSCQSGCPLFVI